jgi:hypothetical protein
LAQRPLFFAADRLADGSFTPLARFMNIEKEPARGEPLEQGKTGMSQSWVKHTSGPRGGESAVPSKVYGAMAITTLLTFASLVSGYEIFFSQSVFA